MPLTAKGAEIKKALTKEYGAAKGEQILYAGKNAGTFTGIDSAKLESAVAKCDEFSRRVVGKSIEHA